jgi:hypothetical protein
MVALSSYEQKAKEEVEAWFRTPDEGLLGRVSRSIFKPVEVMAERLVPDAVLEAAGNGVEALLKGIAHVSDQTVSVEPVLTIARRHAESVDALEDLRRQDLRVNDKVADEIASQHQLIAALEGGGCGAGGIALLAADIPLLFGVAMRVVRLLSASYGVDPFAPGEGVIAFKVFELAAGGTRDRYAELLQIEALRDELDGLEPARRAEKAAVLATMFASREAVKRLVSLLISRKLLQVVPIAGAVVGAGFNYLFVTDVGETAKQVYRRRFIADKARRDR